MALAALPVLVLLAIAPETFALFWPDDIPALGGLFFVLFLLGFDLLGFPKGKLEWTRRRKILAAVTVVVGFFYFAAAAPGQSLTSVIYSVGRTAGARGDVGHPNSESFLTATYFAAFAVYLAVLAVVLFNKNTIRRMITPLAYSMGAMIFYLVDAFLSFDERTDSFSLPFLQPLAKSIAPAVVFLAKLFGLRIYDLYGGLTPLILGPRPLVLLMIIGKYMTCELCLYWPSLVGTLMFSLIMIIVAARLQVQWERKLLYAALGIVSAVIVEVIRTFSIAYYAYAYAMTCNEVNEFEKTIGLFLLPFFVLVFVVFVASIIRIEGWLASRQKPRHR